MEWSGEQMGGLVCAGACEVPSAGGAGRSARDPE